MCVGISTHIFLYFPVNLAVNLKNKALKIKES